MENLFVKALVNAMNCIGGPGAPTQEKMIEMARGMVERHPPSDEAKANAELASRKGIFKNISTAGYYIHERQKALVNARYGPFADWLDRVYSIEIG